MSEINFVFNPEERSLEQEKEYYIQNPTELCLYGLKYGSDKTPITGHTYSPIYHKLFSDMRYKVKNVVELGLGDTPGCNGASLKMWRDFFKNANVYGFDFNKLLLFTETRIKTYYTNQQSLQDLIITRNFLLHSNPELYQEGIDIFIDDGSHIFDDQMRTLFIFWDMIRPGGYFIIEDIYLKSNTPGIDVTFDDYMTKPEIPDFMKTCEFSVYRSSGDNHLIIYKKK